MEITFSKLMKIYDVSLPISSSLPTWPGDPVVSILRTSEIKRGSYCNLSELRLGSHTGTHIDAPYHFVEEGLKVDELPIELLVGRARVFCLEDIERIDLKDIETLDLSGLKRVIFKTTNSQYWSLRTFRKDFVYVTKEAAQFLVNTGIKLVGFDYLSIEKYNSHSAETHHVLLGNGVIILEGLDLRGVQAGDYELIAAPLKLKGGDGAPARVFLREI